MKKNLFMVAAVALIAIVSCNKDFTETVNPEQNGETISFTAFVDGADLPEPGVKAILGTSTNNKPQSKWEAGDAITIHNGTKGLKFTTKDASSASAKFSYAGSDFTAPDGVIAAYPSGTYTVDLSARTITGTIPTNQEGRKDSYNTSAGLAVAYSTTENLAFKNACALLKFKVGSDNVKSITISGYNGEKISGEVKVTLAADGTVSKVEPTSKSQQYVEVWNHDNKLMKKGEVYYIAIIPQEFKYGLKAEIQLNNQSSTKYRIKEIITSFKVERNDIVDLGTMTYSDNAVLGSGWMMPGGYNSWETDKHEARYFHKIGDFYVVRNVKFMDTVSGQSAGFKVMKDDLWKGVSSSANVSLDKWTDLNGTNNIKTGSNEAYDVYVTTDISSIYITKTGSAAPAIPYCKLVVRVNKEINWYNKYIHAWTTTNGKDDNITGNWPGKQMEFLKEDGEYYVYFHKFEASYNQKTIKFIINNGNGGSGNQTKNLEMKLNGVETYYDVHKGLLQ